MAVGVGGCGYGGVHRVWAGGAFRLQLQVGMCSACMCMVCMCMVSVRVRMVRMVCMCMVRTSVEGDAFYALCILYLCI